MNELLDYCWPIDYRGRENEVKIRIRTYSDSITSVLQGDGGIEDYITVTTVTNYYINMQDIHPVHQL